MSAKVIAVSTDNTTYYTLPGSTGGLDNTLSSLDDTIFGQDFKSSQPNLLDWKVTSDAVYKGYTGYSVTIKESGSTTLVTAGGMTQIGSTKSYNTSTSAHNAWDPSVAPIVYDNAVDETANVLSIDFLNGIVTFKSAYTVTGPVTATFNYFPLTEIAKYQKYSLTQSMAPIDTTDIPTAQSNSGSSTYAYGLKTVTLQLDNVYNITTAWQAALAARAAVLIEICPDGTGKSVARGYFKPMSRKQSGKVGALELETVTMELSVPTATYLLTPFKWTFTASDLSMSVQEVLNAFINESALYVKYLPDGGTTSMAGISGSCVIADCTLSGGIDAMNSFSVTFQGTGAQTAV